MSSMTSIWISTTKMLKKYIKADSLEVVGKLTDKYEYPLLNPD